MTKYNKTIIIITLFFVCLGISTPLNFGDDMVWGSASGIDRLHSFFEGYNGRYLGNLLIMAMTRNSFIRVILYALINTGIVVLIGKMAKIKHSKGLVLILLLLLTMPVSVYGETFGWFSGFANYNMGMFFCLLAMVLVENNRPWWLIGIVGFSAQLFMENISLYNVMAAIILFFLWRKKTSFISRMSYLLSTFSGAFFMFSNSVYRKIESGADEYRQIDFGNIFKVFVTDYFNYFLIGNMIIVVLLSILLLYLIKDEQQPIYKVVTWFMTAYTAVIIILNVSGAVHKGMPLLFNISLVTFGLLYLACIVFIIITKNEVFDDRETVIFWGFSAGAILSPFLLIEPFGPRAEFTSYIFFIVIIVYLFDKLPQTFDLKTYVVTAACIISVGLIIINMSNNYVSNERMANVDTSPASKVITIVDVPFSQFGHHLTPVPRSKISHRMFKRYYDIPKDVKINVTKYRNTLYQN